MFDGEGNFIDGQCDGCGKCDDFDDYEGLDETDFTFGAFDEEY